MKTLSAITTVVGAGNFTHGRMCIPRGPDLRRYIKISAR
jgi:hypothetical protein